MDVVEVWKDLRHYEHRYQISDKGRVWDKIQNKYVHIIPPSQNGNGYLRVLLKTKNGKWKTESLHRLIALTFIPNPNNYTCVHHKDENKLNNSISNLQWVTPEYNVSFSLKGRSNWSKGVQKSDAQKEKLSITRKQRIQQGLIVVDNSFKNKPVDVFYNEDFVMQFDSKKSCCEFFNVSGITFGKTLHGNHTTLKGYRFEYHE